MGNLRKLISRTFIERQGNSTARPRTIRLENGGEVILKNVPKEQAEAIIERIKGGQEDHEPELIPAPEAAPVEAAPARTSAVLDNVALGIWHNPSTKKYEVVKLLYNGHTKEAVVDGVLHVEEQRAFAIEEFKINAVIQGIVT